MGFLGSYRHHHSVSISEITMRAFPLRFLIAASIALVGLGRLASTQVQVCSPSYVDPVNGNDLSNPGTLQAPWATVEYAVAQVPFGATAKIVLLPGLHIANNPIVLKPNISIIGTNALNTVLMGNGTDDIFVITADDIVIHGVTITGGGSGVLIDGTCTSLNPTIANCVIVDNCIGIEIVARFNDECVDPLGDTDFNFLPEHHPRIVFCTIADNEIGIYDFGKTPSMSSPAGEADSAIVNSLIFGNTTSDLQGVDLTDLVGSAFGTSQFQTGPLGCHDLVLPPALKFFPPPTSAVDLSGVQPAMVYLSAGTLDYRLRPMTLGNNPLIDVGDPGQIGRQGVRSWTAGNGTKATSRVGSAPCPTDLLSVDEEGHGNPRLQHANFDIGADEVGQLVVYGFEPMSTTFSLSTTPNRTTIIVPDPALPNANPGATHFQGQAGTGYLAQQPSATPGVHPLGTFPCIPAGGQQCTGSTCIDPATYSSGFPMLISTPPTFSGVPVVTALPSVSSATRFNLQVLPEEVGTGQQTCLSNLQSYTVTP